MKSVPRICVVGSAMFDQVIRASRLPSPGETLPGTRFETGYGGKGANQAVMAARLGLDVTLIAKLGRDTIGDATRAHLVAEGIRTDFLLVDEQAASGVASIWVEESTGQNSILIVPGANHTLTPAEVRRAARDIADSAVVVSQLETPMSCAVEAFRIARECGRVQTLLNPAPSRPLSDELWSLTDILAPNETEASALSGLPVGNDVEAERAARELQRRGPPTVIITLGARGLLAVCDERVLRSDAPAVTAIDSTGAGDCFVGSLAGFLAQGLNLEAAMTRACALASDSVTRRGAQSSFRQRGDPLLILGTRVEEARIHADSRR